MSVRKELRHSAVGDTCGQEERIGLDWIGDGIEAQKTTKHSFCERCTLLKSLTEPTTGCSPRKRWVAWQLSAERTTKLKLTPPIETNSSRVKLFLRDDIGLRRSPVKGTQRAKTSP